MLQLIPGDRLTVELELLARLLLAVLLGGLLGFERELGRHAAGLRTHILVTLGATAFTIAGTLGVSGLATNQDPGRVAAQIVTGVGFLGAGAIWRSSQPDGRGTVYGLTTAATIWVAAAVGMLCGFGLYVLAAGTAVIGLLILRLFKPLERLPSRASRSATPKPKGIPAPPPPRRQRRVRAPPPHPAPPSPARNGARQGSGQDRDASGGREAREGREE